MNVFLSKKAILLAMSGLLLATGGCVGSFDPATEGTSHLAPRIQELVDSHRAYPRFENFPSATTDLPTAAKVAADVGKLETSSRTLTDQVAAIEWTMDTDPAAYVASVLRRFDADAMGPIGPQTPQEIEALAEKLGDKAAAPPPIDRPRQ